MIRSAGEMERKTASNGAQSPRHGCRRARRENSLPAVGVYVARVITTRAILSAPARNGHAMALRRSRILSATGAESMDNDEYFWRMKQLAREHRDLVKPLKATAKAMRKTYRLLCRARQPLSMLSVRGNGGAFMKPAPADERTKILLAKYMARKERKKHESNMV